jgi:hypothetical protein
VGVLVRHLAGVDWGCCDVCLVIIVFVTGIAIPLLLVP